ncbi:hypothetical protein Vi05172_g2427 [Venturia inaequalis]|nr:hypothetical protein Vi05172_g2427 [Venturia inaequalis]
MSTIQGSKAQGSTIHGNVPNAIDFARQVTEFNWFEITANTTPSFRRTGNYSDCVIKTQTGEHRVHKIVLCSQSPFFAKAVKKDTFEEGRTGVINLEHDDPQAIAATLDYLYQGHYKCTIVETGDQVLYHTAVFVLADKLGIFALKTYALQFIGTALSTMFGSSPYVELLMYAYESAPPGSAGKGLRALVVEEIKGHGKAAFQLSNGAEFRKMLVDVPELAADLAESLTNDLYKSNHTSRFHGNGTGF